MAYGTVKVDNITFTNGGIDQTVTVSGIVQSISGNITATGTIQGATIIGTSTVSGATVTGNAGVFTTVTGGSAGFTTVTGTTVTGTTANFATISGTTITGSVGNFGSGSAAAPSVSVGTTDNGIYSPGADQLALSTGGVQRVTVNTTVVDSSLPFSVYTASAGASLTGLTINNSSDNASTAARITLQPSTTFNRGCHIEAINSGAGGQPCDLIFGTNPAFSTSTERLRITSAGLVGVGTSTPQLSIGAVGGNVLHLAGAGTTGVRVQNTSGNSIDIYAGTDGFINQSGSGVLNFQLAGSTKATLTSTGLGIGSSAPDAKLEVVDTASSLTYPIAVSNFTDPAANVGAAVDFRLTTGGNSRGYIACRYTDNTSAGGTYLSFAPNDGSTGNVERMRITKTGLVGIGTTSAGYPLEVAANTGIIAFDVDGINGNKIRYGGAGANANVLRFLEYTGTERARIDTSGRLLVGTSSARANLQNGTQTALFQAEGIDNAARSLIVRNSADSGAPEVYLAKSRGAAVGSNTIVAANDYLGGIVFAGADGTEFVNAAFIGVQVDGTPGANDMPGRLVFSTTADGASSPTERMRITSLGDIRINTTSQIDSANLTLNTYSSSSNGIYINQTSTSGFTGQIINRTASDGDLITFLQAGIAEGVISVSGTTVTYGGGHLARWSQLPNDEDPSTLLKGTVMSNLDEMCKWGDEENEQLNKTKVSNVEGDPNVAGVFVAASPSEDGPLDFFVGMTGDMIIRIAADVTVERGDLLMSAGDGTAKPQDDDIIRSKTIAKVTSTNVICTYDDGSYCVPCVLMAC